MNRIHKGIAEAAKDDVADAIKGTGEVVSVAVYAVSRVVTNLIQDTGKSGTSAIRATSEVVRGAIQGVKEVGGDLSLAAKGIVLGVIRGIGKAGEQTLDAIAETAGSIVKNTAELFGDVDSAAKGAVEGAIEGAKEIGLDVEEAASEAATGAVKVAYEISSEAGSKVQKAVTGTISDVKTVIKAPPYIGEIMKKHSTIGKSLTRSAIGFGISMVLLMSLQDSAQAKIIRGEVVSVKDDGSSLSFKRPDPFHPSLTEQFDIVMLPSTKFKNISSLKELAPGDSVVVDAVQKPESKIWEARSVRIYKLRLYQTEAAQKAQPD